MIDTCSLMEAGELSSWAGARVLEGGGGRFDVAYVA